MNGVYLIFLAHPLWLITDKEHLTVKSIGLRIFDELLSLVLGCLKPGWSLNAEISLESQCQSSNVILYHSKLMLRIIDSVSERNW